MSAAGGASPEGERLLPPERLRKRSEFKRCYERGRRSHGSLMTLYATPNDLGHPRIGITASRKVGSAVVRHRLKRRAREIYRRWSQRSQLPALDLVVHFKPPARQASFEELRRELERLLAKRIPGRAAR